MTISREAVDALINRHFEHEARDDVAGVLASMTADAEHEIVPAPHPPRRGHAEIRQFYERLFADLRGESVTPLRRLHGDGFVVDEVIWHGQVVDGRPFLCPGRSGPVSFRLLHVFELDGDRIKRESAWCDLAAIQRQLGVSAA